MSDFIRLVPDKAPDPLTDVEAIDKAGYRPGEQIALQSVDTIDIGLIGAEPIDATGGDTVAKVFEAGSDPEQFDLFALGSVSKN